MTTRYATWDWDTTESIPALVRQPASCDVCDRTPATRCAHGQLVLCKPCETSPEHREYCAAVGAGAGDAR